MSSDYAVLAPVFERIGLADFARSVTSRVINYAQVNDWLGRRILDLGCGTGGATLWFAGHGYFVIGVDKEPVVLAELREALGTLAPNVNIIQGDILELDSLEGVTGADMAYASGVMNSLSSLKELETAFKSVNAVLQPGKFFVFDMFTIQGLTEQGESVDELVVEEKDLFVVRRSDYEYDRQICTQVYHIFQKKGDTWERTKATIHLRAYPVQAVGAMLRRSGFEMVGVIDESIKPVDLASPNVPRVIFVSKKA